MVGVVDFTPVAENHVRSRNTKRLDEGVARFDRVDQELVVEAEPDQFGPDDFGSG